MKLRRTANEMLAAAINDAVAALTSLDIDVAETTVSGSSGAGLHVRVDDRQFTLAVEPVSYCTGQRAAQLVRANNARDGAPRLVVADKITAEARGMLADAGLSWLDRRGRVHLRGPGIRIDADVPVETRKPGASPSGAPITGRSGISVAYWLCAHPGRSVSPTGHADGLGFAPSTISVAASRLADAGLVDEEGAGLFPELFWELADAWWPERTWLTTVPDPSTHLPADPWAATWRRSGTAAAAAYGAPVVSSAGEPVELYVPGPVLVSIAVRRYGGARPGQGSAVVAVAPTSLVTAGPGDSGILDLDGWPAAPVLTVALDLAQDRSRGREILADWEHPDAVWR